jgi:hypothetical protein
MAIKYIYQNLPSQDPPKFIQIGIFGLKIYLQSGNLANGAKVRDGVTGPK